ncbi:hypothetical protein Mgra_00004123 [Meloidogyne graminicola]|uniref:Uncharacterized protein n=1 Tax=Meloidogyne graminicola TaxID=189291 RepID=A0A8S9ZTG0_9BILA|nr:hypothetical protein Mgra_00004123 [Meloidogyne graminicola]
MGRKNPIKHLFISTSNNDVESEIVALTYYLNGISRDMSLKIDVNNIKAITITNVPYYIDENVLHKICSDSLEAPLTDVQFTTSTAQNCNLKAGYRSGHLFFNTIQDKRRAFEKAKLMNNSGKVVNLEKFGVKLLAWHKIYGKTSKREYYGKEEENLIDSISPKKKKTTKNDDVNGDNWTVVTNKHKFSFRGKINRNVKENKV